MDRQQLAADDVLRNLPSHGWTAGWTGRRDRALIVLSQVADLPYQRIARLSAGDISFADGAATIDGPDGATTVAPEQQRPAVRSVCARSMAACPRPDRPDHGAGITQVAPGIDVTELRAGALEKRIRQILDYADNRDN